MTKAVVDELEMVEVDEHHRDRKQLALGVHRLPQAVVQQAAVRKTRERIVVGLVLDLYLVVLALDRIVHRSHQELAVELALDEVVLGADLDRRQRHRLVVVAGEHDDRNLGRVRVDFGEGVQAMAIRQRQVEQYQPGFFRGEEIQPVRQPLGAVQPERRIGILRQHFADEACVARVVFDQQDGVRGDAHSPLGSVTTVSQNMSIDWTTTMNFSRSTGLVT